MGRGQAEVLVLFLPESGSECILLSEDKKGGVSHMNKSAHKMNRAFMHKNIPYRYCFEEGGMIETEKGIFTRTYKFLPPDAEVKGSYHSGKTRMLMEEILQKLAEKFTYEFTIRNCHMSREKYLSGIMLEEKEDAYHHLRRLYNKVLQDNCDIGHNNFTREVYLTLALEADVPDMALEQFLEAEQWLQELFYSLYGYRIQALTLPERMELLYDIYHPEADAAGFGEKVDYDGKGFSVKSMQQMKMDTKDTIAPEWYEVREKDYMKIGSYYVRNFFISSIPESVPDSVLPDLAAVSSNSIVSVHYQRVDQELGFLVAAKLVGENTEVKNIPVRDTVADRKEHRTQRQERHIREEENEYFYNSALNLFKKSKAKGQAAIQASFLITLFADNLEELNRDSALLHLSASKYACQIRCLHLQQNEGFQSMLPLCNLKVNVGRVFTVEQMAVMQPLSIQGIFEKVRTFYGLNAINDNFVFWDRSIYSAAMIVGTANTGKSVSVMREAANTLLSTRADVVILARHPEEYRAFSEKMLGQVLTEFYPDIFEKDSNYNLNKEKHILQKMFLEAYLTSKIGFHRQRLVPEVLLENYKQVEKEAELLCRFETLNEALLYAKDHPVELQLFVKTMENFHFATEQLTGNHRLTVLGYEKEEELLVNLDYLWNYAVQNKKKNRTVWIFVDAVDDLIYSTTGSDYLISLLERAEVLKVPVTLVIQDAVNIVTNQNAVIEFDYLLNKIRFFKLLSLGPIERRKFIERLNISEQLIPYFVGRGPGEGILVTPSANVAFNDRFEDNEFYGLFH